MFFYYLVEHSSICFLDVQTLRMYINVFQPLDCRNSTWHMCRTVSFPLPSPSSKKTYIHFSCTKTSVLDELESLSTCWIGLFAQARYLFEVQRNNNTYIWDVLWANTKVKSLFFPSWYINECAVIHMYTCTKHTCVCSYYLCYYLTVIRNPE